jgi:tRNA 2-thiouridine synthesizing protein E
MVVTHWQEGAAMMEMLLDTEIDEYGLLRNPADWSPELAQELARRAGLGPLTESHWAFLMSLRDYYQKFHAPPPPHKVCHDLHMSHSCSHELFGHCLSAWRIAGLPDPGEEAKSYLAAD